MQFLQNITAHLEQNILNFVALVSGPFHIDFNIYQTHNFFVHL